MNFQIMVSYISKVASYYYEIEICVHLGVHHCKLSVKCGDFVLENTFHLVSRV